MFASPGGSGAWMRRGVGTPPYGVIVGMDGGRTALYAAAYRHAMRVPTKWVRLTAVYMTQGPGLSGWDLRPHMAALKRTKRR